MGNHRLEWTLLGIRGAAPRDADMRLGRQALVERLD
jgi:hypothetical protein